MRIGRNGSRNKSEVLPSSDDLHQSVCSQKIDRPSKVVRKERKPGFSRYLDLPLGQQIVGPVPSLYSPVWVLHDGVTLSQMLLVWIEPKNYGLLPWTLAWRYRDWSERKIRSARDQSTGCSLIKCFLFSDLALLESDCPGLGKSTSIVAFFARSKSAVPAVRWIFLMAALF